MSDFPREVLFREEGAREGFQSEPNFVPTEDKVRLIDALSETGTKLLQITSFVHPKWVPQMADAEDVVARVKMKPGVRYFGAYLNEHGLVRSIGTKRLQQYGILTQYCCDGYAQKNVNRSNAQILETFPDLIRRYKQLELDIYGSILCAFGSNYDGAVSVQRVLQAGACVPYGNLQVEYGKSKDFTPRPRHRHGVSTNAPSCQGPRSVPRPPRSFRPYVTVVSPAGRKSE